MLAALGLSIGVATVMAMVAVGEGAKLEIQKKLERYGTNVLVVRPVRKEVAVGRSGQTSEPTSLFLTDAQRILEQIKSVEKIAPHMEGAATVKYGARVSQVVLDGSNSDFFELKNYTLASGRLFDSSELKSAKRVVIIGDQIKDVLFGSQEAVGKQLTLRRIPYDIIGVLQPKGINTDGANEDEHIVIPLKTMERRVLNKPYLTNIFVQVRNSHLIDSTELAIEQQLRDNHDLNRFDRRNDFTIGNQLRAVRTELEASRSFSLLTLSVAGLSLFVGGTGILAIMWLSVSERLPEIGLRMAIGATRRDLAFQFLAESVMLSFSGGMLGILLGLASAYFVGQLTDWVTAIPDDIVLMALGCSTLTGVLFGLVPAIIASAKSPIVCLSKT